MKCLTPILLVLATSAPLLKADEYLLSVRSNGQELASVDLQIEDSTAVTKAGDVTEHFDLENLRWQHEETGQWVSLEQSKEWAELSKAKSMESKAAIPEEVRAFVLWSLDPKFEVEVTDGVLMLTSGQVDYKIKGKKPDKDLSGYFRYARLNAYKKAMAERKLPPFAELRAIEEMERRGMLPESMEVSIRGIPNSPMITLMISEK